MTDNDDCADDNDGRGHSSLYKPSSKRDLYNTHHVSRTDHV